MTPRQYSMSVRAERAEHTRARILDAALACYRESGVGSTSLLAIARRAEVSPATILNHFGSAGALAVAVIDGLAASLQVPDDSVWPPEESQPRRIQRLVDEMFEFYERSRPWFDIFRADLGVDSALREGEERFWQQIGALYGRVFGKALADDRSRGATFGLTSPATFVALRDAGMSVGSAAELVADTLVRTVAAEG